VRELNSTLGERFLFYRPLRLNPDAEAMSAANRDNRASAWRDEIAQQARDQFFRAEPWLEKVQIPDWAKLRCVDLARLTADGRATVERDGYRKEVRFIPESEGPARLTGQFIKLLHGLCAVRWLEEPGQEELDVLAKISRDSMHSRRLRVMDALYRGPGDAKSLSERTQLPPTTVKYELQDLKLLNVAQDYQNGTGLTEEFFERCDRSGLFALFATPSPEKTERPRQNID